MDKSLLRRIEKIERALGAEKGVCLRLPDGEGGYIEVPGCRTLADMLVLAGVRKRERAMNETERK